MKILSQRDDRWKNKKLGWSNVTIGGYGCLITCLAMMADLLPDEVNERLKNVIGYANLNLVIWAKIKEAIPWLEFEWRGWSYDNAKVLETIKKHGSCIVEVDFDGTPRTDDMHFVLFVGNGKMYDPWTGRECSTSKYKILKGFVVIKPTKGEPMGDSPIDKDLQTNANNWHKLMKKLMVTELSVDEVVKTYKKVVDLTTDSNNWNAVRKAYKIESVEELTSLIGGISESTQCKRLLTKKDEECMKKINDLKKQHTLKVKILKKQLERLEKRKKLLVKTWQRLLAGLKQLLVKFLPIKRR